MKFIFALLVASMSFGLLADTVSRYDFYGTTGESVGTVADAMGNYDGTGYHHANAALTYSDDIPGGAGSVLMPNQNVTATPITANWKSIEFTTGASDDTQGAYVNIPDLGKRIAKDGAAGAFTVEYFVKLAAHRSWRTMIKFGYMVDDTGVETMYYSKCFEGKYVDNGGSCYFQYNTANLNGTSMTLGQWYHVALVYKPGTLTVYKDGAVTHTCSLTITNSSSTTNFRIGGASTTSECLSGKIAGVRISDTALEPTEFLRSSRFNQEEYERQGGICGLWSFSEGTAGETVTAAPNAFDAADTLVGSLAATSGKMPRYSDDAPAPRIWLSSTNHTVIATNVKSAQFFATSGGALTGTPNQDGGKLEMKNCRSRMMERGAFTLEYFVKTDASFTWSSSFGMNVTNTSSLNFGTSDNPNAYGYEWPTPSNTKHFSSVTDAVLRRWHHVAMAWDSETKTFDYYVDYVKKTNPKTGAEFAPSGDVGYFGCRVGGGNPLNGKITCIRLTPRRLNPADMMVVAKDEGYDDQTLFHWSFEDPCSADVADITEVSSHPTNAIGRRGRVGYNYSRVGMYSNVVDRPFAAYTRQRRELLQTNSLSAYFFGYSDLHQNDWSGSQIYLGSGWDTTVRPASFTLELFARRDLAAATGVGFSSHGQLLASFGNSSISTDSANVDFYIALDGETKKISLCRNDSWGTLASIPQSGDLEDGEWHHLAWTYDNETYTYCQYVDYRLVSTHTDTKPMRRTTGSGWTWTFGRGVNCGGFLGWMDDIRVSNCVRPVSEFLRHRNAPGGTAIILR